MPDAAELVRLQPEATARRVTARRACPAPRATADHYAFDSRLAGQLFYARRVAQLAAHSARYGRAGVSVLDWTTLMLRRS